MSTHPIQVRPIGVRTPTVPLASWWDSAFSPTQIAGLQLWLKADAIVGLNDGDPVATWPDSSGLGNDATQGTPAARPAWIQNGLNALPVVRGDSLDDGMVTGLVLVPPYEIVIVGRHTAIGGANARLLQSTIGNNLISGLRVDGLCVYMGGGISDALFGDTNGHLANLRVPAAGNVSYFLDGVDRTTAPVPVGNWGNVVLGAAGAFAEAAVGDWAELLIYNAILSAANRVSLTTYLGRWGI